MWYQIIPVTGVTFGIFFCMDAIKAVRARLHYRGIFDNRVAMETHLDEDQSLTRRRLIERDMRLSFYPNATEWVHPLWSPKHIAEEMKASTK